MHPQRFIAALALLTSAAALPAQSAEPSGSADCAAETVRAQEPPSINQLRAERGLTSKSNVFVPQGQWIFGGTASYSTHSNDNYDFLVIEGIKSDGFTFRVSPFIAYAVRDNMALGARFIYSRSLLKLNNAQIHLGDEGSGVNLDFDYYYALEHTYSGVAVWRQYIPLGESKRFALFTEMQLSASGSQAKFAADQPVRGTYQTGYHLGLGVVPGLVAFATNNMAIEVSVGVMGINYSHTRQVHNQVRVGKRSTSNMNFKVNIFSIGLGMAFYL